MKKQRTCKEPRLEKALIDWVCEESTNGIQVSSAMVRELATYLKKEANKTLASSEQLQLEFSNKCSESLQSRFGIKGRRSDKEFANVDISDILAHLRVIMELPSGDTVVFFLEGQHYIPLKMFGMPTRLACFFVNR